MKVKELIAYLESCNPESDFGVALREGNRPYGYIQSNIQVETVIDMNTNKVRYVLDVNIEESLKP